MLARSERVDAAGWIGLGCCIFDIGRDMEYGIRHTGLICTGRVRCVRTR